ncbi:MAG: metalloregulator ArsR/SmtB family transcription factor [Fimbriimonadaceae bacterium]|nr:metalloregulator ArsR/SmtB family transcription factor [Fimbriimonadaceae bacterium]
MKDQTVLEYLIRELGETSKRSLLVELRLGPKSVSQLVHATGLKQPNVSNHLARLRERQLVRTQRVGRQIFYSLQDPIVEEALDSILDSSEIPSGEPVALDRDLVIAFTKHLVSGDEMAASLIVDRLLRTGVEVEKIYADLFATSLTVIGEWWMVEAIDAGQEHLASATIERLMARAMHYASPHPTQGATCVVGCCAGNQHSIGARMVSDVMRLSGWNSIYLGANVPHDSFINATRNHSPLLVMVSSSTLESIDHLLDCVRALNEERQPEKTFCLGVGGRAAVKNAKECLLAGADFVASNLNSVKTEIATQLLTGRTFPSGVFGEAM